MAKLTILVATMAAFLLLVDASIYRTTVIVDEEGPSYGTGRGCSDQFRQQQELNGCQEYIRQQIRQSEGRPWRRYTTEELTLCCNQLEKMDTPCRCEGLTMAVQQQQQEMGMREEQMRRALTTAQEIPGMCRLQPSRCDFRTPLEA